MKPFPLPRPSRPPMLTCSTCGTRFYLDATDSPPFCSERCRMIDLGRWLEEQIEIPHEGGPNKEESWEADDR